VFPRGLQLNNHSLPPPQAPIKNAGPVLRQMQKQMSSHHLKQYSDDSGLLDPSAQGDRSSVLQRKALSANARGSTTAETVSQLTGVVQVGRVPRRNCAGPPHSARPALLQFIIIKKNLKTAVLHVQATGDEDTLPAGHQFAQLPPNVQVSAPSCFAHGLWHRAHCPDPHT
jgi:hypothetical protein